MGICARLVMGKQESSQRRRTGLVSAFGIAPLDRAQSGGGLWPRTRTGPQTRERVDTLKVCVLHTLEAHELAIDRRELHKTDNRLHDCCGQHDRARVSTSVEG